MEGPSLGSCSPCFPVLALATTSYTLQRGLMLICCGGRPSSKSGMAGPSSHILIPLLMSPQTHLAHLGVVHSHLLMGGFNSNGQRAGAPHTSQPKNWCQLCWLQHSGAQSGTKDVSVSDQTTWQLSASFRAALLVTHLLRCLVFYAVVYHFDFQAEHLPGTHNSAADAISRNNLTLFFSLIPQIPQVLIPQAIRDLLVEFRPNWGSHEWTVSFKNSWTRVSPKPPTQSTSQAGASLQRTWSTITPTLRTYPMPICGSDVQNSHLGHY